MSKTSWSILFLCTAALFFLSCDSDDDNSVGNPDYRYNTVFRCTGPLTADCAGDVPITEFTQVRIFYDTERDGPDVHDDCPTPPGYVNIPEAWFANFADFYFDGASFVSPVFKSGGGLMSFYLRAYTGENGRVVWTSPMFSLIAHTGPPDTVDLPASEWTCELAETDPPQCFIIPGSLEFVVGYNTDEPFCIETCDGAQTSVLFSRADSVHSDELPIMLISGSCDDTPDGHVDFLPAAWQQERYGDFWSLRFFTGRCYGKATISWLDSVPCANVDELSVTRTESNSVVAWHTSFEEACTGFEVWFMGLPDQYSAPTLLGEVSASGNAADYSFNAPRLQAGYSFQFTIVAVDNDGNKYPAKRVVSAS
ncbi:MAG: hypothetical protein H6506_01985 [Calditrichaeota bacterium]|nr:hypothetical protein [Calditrichota bacterium]MCB9391402.1 hypothetical protein [Calditrichota bacterium]